MRARLVALSSASALLATLAVAACKLTSGLTGVPLDDDAGDPDAGAGCDADTTASVENCGACGRACPVGANSYAACVDSGCVMACAAGFGDCDEAGANGCETNTATSRSACGRCAHDCLGGQCANGNCQRVVLESDINSPVHIVTDGTYVYGVNAFGTVVRVPKAGGNPTLLASGDSTAQSPPPRIAIANGSLYYTSFGAPDAGDAGGAGSISTVVLDGGKPTVLTQATLPLAIDANQTSVYWSEGNPSSSPYSAGVKRCKLTNCSANVEQVIATTPGRIYSILLDPQGLVWANAGTNGGSSDNLVARCNPGNCAPSTFPLGSTPPSPSGATGLASDKTTIYWTTMSSFIASCPLAGCSGDAARLDSFQFTPRYIAYDGGTIFWTNADGTIKSLPRGGPASSERVVYQVRGASPWDIAVDSEAIYWTDVNGAGGGPPGASALLKLAR